MTKKLAALTLLLALIALAIRCAHANSEPALPDAPPPPDVAEGFAPGLAVTFESAKPNPPDARINRLAALLVPAASSPTPFLAPGPFKATFEGFIDQKLRGDFEFSARGNGKVSLAINDKPIFDATGDFDAAEGKKASLKKGKNKLTIVYESPAEGDALLRIFWSSDDFQPEPIDPKLLTHATANKPLASALRLREGRALFADLHCAKCHADPMLLLSNNKDVMPELAKDAPNLDEAAARLRPAWMARWISNPKSLRPDTAMPNIFHGQAGATLQQGADIAAYLATLGATPAEPKPPAADEVAAGGRLIARLGCIGCHTLPDKDLGADPTRVPWHFIKAKYTAPGLIDFLKQPEKHFAWIRMPNFRLTDAEANDVAAYLIANSKDLEGTAPKGDPANGKSLVQSSGCVNCHGLKLDNNLKTPLLSDIPKDGWTRGCMATDVGGRATTHGSAPDFGLSPQQRTALLAFAATDRSSLHRDALPEFAERQITELRCVACHNRDTIADVWDANIKETDALSKGDAADPESAGAGGAAAPGAPHGLPGEPAAGTGDPQRPPLTWTGEKLHPEWMATFIAGKLDYKPRAWIHARMPGFPARADGLAKGMALQHACPTTSPEMPKPDDAAAVIGKQLVGRNGGFSCIQCHGIANIGPISPFEAPSINFKYTAERIRREYYDRWMRNPIRLVPTTKMPSFADAEGKTSLREILEGDASKQFDAIWNYLLAGRKIEHPEQ